MSHKKPEKERLSITKTVRFSPIEWKIVEAEIKRIRLERPENSEMEESVFFRSQIFNFPEIR